MYQDMDASSICLPLSTLRYGNSNNNI